MRVMHVLSQLSYASVHYCTMDSKKCKGKMKKFVFSEIVALKKTEITEKVKESVRVAGLLVQVVWLLSSSN